MITPILDSKTILITGVAGFIGGALALRLIQEYTHAHIVGMDNMNSYYDLRLKEYRLAQIQNYSNFTFVKADVADKRNVGAVFQTFRPDIVVHLAAQAGVRESIDHPDVYIQSNIIGFYNILEACRHSYDVDRGVEHLVYASSSSVYGADREPPYSMEDRTDAPVSLYAATKKCDEVMAHAYAKLYDIPATGLRFFTVYGPAGRPDMAYFNFADRLRMGKKIRIFNYGDCRRDFTYIDDIVEAMIRVMGRPPLRKTGPDGLPVPPCAIYDIGHGSPVGLLKFVNTLQRALANEGVLPQNFDLAGHIDLVPMQPGDVPVTFADTSALERDFGYRPSVPLETGLQSFAKWYREFYGFDGF